MQPRTTASFDGRAWLAGSAVTGASFAYNQKVRVHSGEFTGEVGWIVAIQPSLSSEPIYTVELMEGEPNAAVAESSLEPAA